MTRFAHIFVEWRNFARFSVNEIPEPNGFSKRILQIFPEMGNSPIAIPRFGDTIPLVKFATGTSQRKARSCMVVNFTVNNKQRRVFYVNGRMNKILFKIQTIAFVATPIGVIAMIWHLPLWKIPATTLIIFVTALSFRLVIKLTEIVERKIKEQNLQKDNERKDRENG